MEKTKKSSIGIAGGIFFLLTMLIYLAESISYSGFRFSRLITLIGFAVIGVVLFLRRTNIITPISFSILWIANAYNLLNYLSLYNLLVFIAYSMIIVLSVFSCKNYIFKAKNIVCKLWFIPSILILIALVFVAVDLFSTIPYRSFWQLMIQNEWILYLYLGDFVEFLAILLTCRWISSPYKKVVLEDEYVGVKEDTPINTDEVITCNLATHILLLLFTFGIWYYIWIYKMTKYTNTISDEEYRDPIKKLLLCMFVPFYIIYWIYKTAQRIDTFAQRKSIQSDLSTLCLVLAIFVSIVPPILIQEKVNTIVTAEQKNITKETHQQSQSNIALGTAEELKTYKELLDNGVITQEEFDAKKKQLLGL